MLVSKVDVGEEGAEVDVVVKPGEAAKLNVLNMLKNKFNLNTNECDRTPDFLFLCSKSKFRFDPGKPVWKLRVIYKTVHQELGISSWQSLDKMRSD